MKTAQIFASCSLATLLLGSLSVRAQDQNGSQGDWHCALDAGNGVNQQEPPQGARIAHKEWGLAGDNGSVVADLAKNGIGNIFLYAHLHGVQNDRYGMAEFWMAVLVEDSSGYVYMATPSHYDTVHGIPKLPRRHIHCAGQFIPNSGELMKAVDKGVPLQLIFLGGRHRDDLGGDLDRAFQKAWRDFVSGKLTSDAFASLLNQGKKAFMGK